MNLEARKRAAAGRVVGEVTLDMAMECAAPTREPLRNGAPNGTIGPPQAARSGGRRAARTLRELDGCSNSLPLCRVHRFISL